MSVFIHQTVGRFFCFSNGARRHATTASPDQPTGTPGDNSNFPWQPGCLVGIRRELKYAESGWRHRMRGADGAANQVAAPEW